MQWHLLVMLEGFYKYMQIIIISYILLNSYLKEMVLW